MVLDSNIIIGFLSGDRQIVAVLSQWKRDGRALFLPAVVEIEILSFPKLTFREKQIIERFIQELVFVPVDRRIARLAAEIRLSSRIKLPDAVIAATALSVSSPLVTRNTRDFQKIRGLDVVKI